MLLAVLALKINIYRNDQAARQAGSCFTKSVCMCVALQEEVGIEK